MRRHLAALASLLLAPVALAQDRAEPQLPPLKDPAPDSPATRADLAEAYARLETAFRDHPPSTDRLARINKDVDGAVLKHFAGDYVGAIHGLNDATNHLVYGEHIPPAAAFAASLKVSCDPVTWLLNGPVEITVTRMYDAPVAPGPVLMIRANGGEIMSREPLGGTIPFWSSYDVNMLVRKGEWLYRLEVMNGDDTYDLAKMFGVYTPFDRMHQSLVQSITMTKPQTPELEQAAAACRSRASLLSDHPSQVESAQFLPDLITLQHDVEKEAQQIRNGQDPYFRRTGDYWRTVAAAGADIPCRVFVPAGASSTSEKHPLLIALHGAGGDESTFFEVYGAGSIKLLAEKHGLIVVCPQVSKVNTAAAMNGLIEAIGMTYAVDPSRIYLVGHSSGASVAGELVPAMADRLAAVVCMGGAGRMSGGSTTVPTLIYAGAADTIASPDRLKASAEGAAKAGLPVELRTVPDCGHALLVAAKLPEAVGWLVTHQRQ
jgi:predicted esterase